MGRTSSACNSVRMSRFACPRNEQPAYGFLDILPSVIMHAVLEVRRWFMVKDFTTPKEDALEAENAVLRVMLAQAGIDASQLLVKAGIDATEHEAAARLQRLLLEELHHRVKNTLATVMAIISQSLKNATTMEQGREAIAHRLIALGRAHDLLLQTSWTSASLPASCAPPSAPLTRPAQNDFRSRGRDRCWSGCGSVPRPGAQ